jgi:ribose-phosphate pyrophosphokinase
MTDYVIFAGTANPDLAAAVAAQLNIGLGRCRVQQFPDGELSVNLLDPVRRREVFLVQPTSPPVNEHLMELLVFADACRRASAERITAVVPYFGYARADRRLGLHQSITARMVSDLLESVGIHHVITFNLHTAQMEGFFRVPVDNLSAVDPLFNAVRNKVHPETLVVAPDAGAVRMASEYARRFGTSVVVLHKQRDTATQTRVTHAWWLTI